MTKTAILAIALLASVSAHADIYKCTDADGKPTFSQTPCAKDAAPIAVNVARPTPEQVSQHAARMEENRAWIEEGAARRRAQESAALQRQRIEHAERQHAAEIAAIAQRRSRTANNLAGATMDNALAVDEANANARYQAEMDRLLGVR